MYGRAGVQRIVGAGRVSQAPAARAVVGLYVRVNYVRDAQVITCGDIEILDNVQLRVYDRADSFSLSAKDIGCATGLRP